MVAYNTPEDATITKQVQDAMDRIERLERATGISSGGSGPHASTHADGGADEVTLSIVQITSLDTELLERNRVKYQPTEPVDGDFPAEGKQVGYLWIDSDEDTADVDVPAMEAAIAAIDARVDLVETGTKLYLYNNFY